MEELTPISTSERQHVPPPCRPSKRILLLFFWIFLFLEGIFYTSAITRQGGIFNPFAKGPSPESIIADPEYALPTNDPNRLNVLVMGIEGMDDSNAATGGPLLIDSIQVFSYDKTTKKVSLISIPRDLYVKIHGDKKDKLNTAYEYGYYHSSDPLRFVKDKISQISGVYIDQGVIFDFSAFKGIVDALGGVDVTLSAPFSEPKQWGYPFSLPAGMNHLDGQSALYYVR